MDKGNKLFDRVERVAEIAYLLTYIAFTVSVGVMGILTLVQKTVLGTIGALAFFGLFFCLARVGLREMHEEEDGRDDDDE